MFVEPDIIQFAVGRFRRRNKEDKEGRDKIRKGKNMYTGIRGRHSSISREGGGDEEYDGETGGIPKEKIARTEYGKDKDDEI